MNGKTTVYYGVPVITMSDTLPEAEAVCVAQGRILAVGTREAVCACAGPQAEQVDLRELGGSALYPGFIDTHSHLSQYSACLDQAYCGNSLGSIAGVLDALRSKAAESAASDSWVLGYGYDDSGISDKRHLTRHDLDAVCADRPVFVTHISVHFGYANTLGLRLLGMTADRRIPGGDIALGEDGQPLGLLAENAAFAAFQQLPTPDASQTCTNMQRAIAEYNKCGFTTILDGGIGISDPEIMLGAYMALNREHKLHARFWLQMVPTMMDKLLPYGLWDFGGDYLKLGGVKYFTDGSIQGFTAALLEDYHSRPGFKGELLFDPETITEVICRYHCLGMQVAVHTNGDAATEAVLQGFERAVTLLPRTDLRHMIVHAQLASDDQLARMKRLGIIPTLFSRHIENWGDRHKAIFLGPQRVARMNPAGSCVRLNMPFSLHVDSPVLPPTALGSMHAAVNRISDGGELLGADQRISGLDALRAYTTHAALTCGGEHNRGRLEPGYFADFVLLSDRPEKADPRTIRGIQVCATICGGQVVYQK